MINFPLNPELNEEYIHQNAFKYKWDGVKWIAVERIAPEGNKTTEFNRTSPTKSANYFVKPINYESPLSDDEFASGTTMQAYP